MLDPKFRIPRVMVGGLALGGVVAGCGSDASPEAELISDLCLAQEACDPVDFAEYYDSQAECRQLNTEALDETGVEYGAACRAAVVAYYACLVPQYAATCGAEDVVGCDAEYDAYVAACD